MDSYFEELSALSKAPRLIPAENIICSKLLDFEAHISENLTDSDLAKIEQILLQFLNVNQGQISLQCSSRIAECLCKIYTRADPPRIWELVAFVTQSSYPSSIYAVGSVVKAIGGHMKSKIPGLVSNLLGQPVKLIHSVLYALSACYQRAPSELHSYHRKTINLAKRGIVEGNDAIQLISLKLLKSMLNSPDVDTNKILGIAELAYSSSANTYVSEYCSTLVAKIIYIPFRNVKTTQSEGDFSLEKQAPKKSLIPKAFEIMKRFKDNFESIFAAFVNYLTPEFISANVHELFSTIYSINTKILPQLIAYFGNDVKKEFFASLSKKSPLPFKLLVNLLSDTASLHELASIAMQLIITDPSSDISQYGQFFGKLAKVDPDHALLYLDSASLYLACPPDDSQETSLSMRGFAFIIKYILGSISDRESASNRIADNITAFLKTALDSGVMTMPYTAAFHVLIPLPDYLIDKEHVTSAIDRFMSHVKSTDSFSDKHVNTLKRIATLLALFLNAHRGYEISKTFFSFMSDRIFLTTRTVLLAMMNCAPTDFAGDPFIPALLKQSMNFLLNNTPSLVGTKSLISQPMETPTRLLQLSSTKANYPPLLLSKVDKEEFAERVISTMPDFLFSLSTETASEVVENILTNLINYKMHFSLLISIARNPNTRGLFGRSLWQHCVNQLSDGSFNATTQQLICELMGTFASYNSAHYKEDMLNLAETLPIEICCFLYVSAITHLELTTADITRIMHKLNDIALHTTLSVYALHALSVLYQSQAMSVVEALIPDIQCEVILSLLNHKMMYKAFDLRHLSRCFVSLLPIVSTQLASNPQLSNTIKLIIMGFKQIDLPYSDDALLEVTKSVIHYAPAFASDPVYPTSRGVSLIRQLDACQAFADYLDFSGPDDGDCFDLLPRVMLVLQKTGKLPAVRFVEALAHKFAASKDYDSEKVRSRLVDWIKVIKTTLTSNLLPVIGSASIEPKDFVKSAVLMAAKQICPVLAQSKPLLTECMDDFMTSITRAIETRVESVQKPAFEILVMVIKLFKDTMAAEGRLLDLYESQFSIALRAAFKCDLQISSQFLITLLDFRIETNNFVESSIYFECLKNYKRKSYAAIAVVAHVCVIASQNPKIFEYVKDFIFNYGQSFIEVISIARALWRMDPPDWDQIQEFRAKTIDFFAELLPAYVWLEAQFNVNLISRNVLIAFLMRELEESKESWRVIAAFEGLYASVKYFKLTDEEKKKAMATVKECKKSSLYAERLPDFSLCASQGDDFEGALAGIIRSFKVEPMAKCLHNASSEFIFAHAEEISKALVSNQLNDTQLVAFFTLLFDKAPKSTEIALPILVKQENLKPQTVLQIIRRGLKRNSVFIDEVGQYVWRYFGQGGMIIIAKQEESRYVDNFIPQLEAVLLNASNILALVPFLEIIASRGNLQNEAEFARIVFSALVQQSAAGIDERELVRGIGTVLHMVSEKGREEGFRKAGQRDQQVGVQIMERGIQKIEHGRKGRVLKTFSENTRRSNTGDSEWQSLDESDSD